VEETETETEGKRERDRDRDRERQRERDREGQSFTGKYLIQRKLDPLQVVLLVMWGVTPLWWQLVRGSEKRVRVGRNIQKSPDLVSRQTIRGKEREDQTFLIESYRDGPFSDSLERKRNCSLGRYWEQRRGEGVREREGGDGADFHAVIDLSGIETSVDELSRDAMLHLNTPLDSIINLLQWVYEQQNVRESSTTESPLLFPYLKKYLFPHSSQTPWPPDEIWPPKAR
jgi:hypothetical protein